jgi:hypothetical protein
MNLQHQGNATYVNQFQAKLCIRNWKLCTVLLNIAARSDGINQIPNLSYSSPIAPNVMLTPVVPEPEKSTENEYFLINAKYRS